MTGKELKKKLEVLRSLHIENPDFDKLKIRIFAGIYAYLVLTDGASDIHTIELYGKHTPKTW